MNRLKEILNRLTAIHDRQTEITETVDSDHDGKYPENLRTEFDTLQNEFDTLAEEKKTLEADIARAKQLQNRADILREPAENRILQPQNTLENSRPQPQDAERQRTVIHATCRRGDYLQNFRSRKDDRRTPEERAYRFGMFALAQMSMHLPSKFHFQNAIDFSHGAFNMNKTVDGNGTQVLIPEEFMTDMIDLRNDYGLARRTFFVVPMTSDTLTRSRRASGLTAYPVGEAGAGTESTKGWNKVSLTARKWMVISRYTSEVNEDIAINIGDDLMGEISYAFAYKEDDCCFNGTGASTYHGIQGIRYRLDNVSGSTDSAGVHVQTTGNTWPALVLADFSAVIGLLPQYADRNGQVSWVCHKTFYHTVMQPLELAAGGNTVMEIREGNRSPRPLFLGYPVDFSEVFPSTTATSTICATLGNYRMGAMFGDRRSETIQFSDVATVGGDSLFETDEVAIKGTERFDFNAHDVGTTSTAGPICGLKTGS